jgi:O-antigen ligase
MAPLLALALSLTFSAWLLIRDVRSRSLTAAVWIPTIVLFILCSRPVTLWLGFGGVVVSQDNYVEGSPIDRAFYLTMIFASVIVVMRRRLNWGRLSAVNVPLLAFYAYFLVSVFWSDDPLGSFKRLFKDFGLIVIALAMLSEKNPFEAVRGVYVRCASVLIPLSIVFIKYFPHLGREYTRGGEGTFTGVTTQKNSLGEIVMVFCIFLLWDFLERPATGSESRWYRWDRVLLIGMGVWLLNISESKTALMCLGIGLVLVTRARTFATKTMNSGILAAALAVPVLLLTTQQFTAVLSPVVEALGRDLTFTGRTDIWRAVLAQDINPLFGTGYWNFWGNAGGDSVRSVLQVGEMKGAHNGYLDIYVDGGWIGIALLAFILVITGRRLTRPMAARYHRVRFALLIIAVLYNLSESAYARLCPIWFTTLLILIDPEVVKGIECDSDVAGVGLDAAVVNPWESVRTHRFGNSRLGANAS